MFGDWLMLWLKLTILFSKAYSIHLHYAIHFTNNVRQSQAFNWVILSRTIQLIQLNETWHEFTYIMLFTSQTVLGKAKRLIESFWVKPSNWSKLTKHSMTVRSEAAVGKSVRNGKLCANVTCPNVWRHTQKKVGASVRGLTELVRKVFLWIDNMHRANCPFHLH